jgi:16S rRNA (guanine(966)-N(2))-methyltransferase RsmD
MAKPLKTSAPVRANHEIRIIGGAWRRTRIAVRDLPGLRPTPDRVRETLFNWLGQDLSGWRCLDVFAGTGVLGCLAGRAKLGKLREGPAIPLEEWGDLTR